MIDFSSIINEHSNKPIVSGEWFTIQWTPDIATGEKLNIGVCFKDSSGQSYAQLLEYYDRINCLYSFEYVFHLRMACEVASELAFSNEYLKKSAFESIAFKSNGYAQGESADDIVSSLFSNVVPLAVKRVKPKEKVYHPINRDRLLNKMNGFLKSSLDFDEYFRMVEPTPLKRVSMGNQSQSLFLPYKAGKSIGTIASAAYADGNIAKCNLYDAQRDVSLALANFKEFKSAAIFILSPGCELNTNRRDQVDLEIDKFCWYLKTQSVLTEVESDPYQLADKASHWYRNKVA